MVVGLGLPLHHHHHRHPRWPGRPRSPHRSHSPTHRQGPPTRPFPKTTTLGFQRPSPVPPPCHSNGNSSPLGSAREAPQTVPSSGNVPLLPTPGPYFVHLCYGCTMVCSRRHLWECPHFSYGAKSVPHYFSHPGLLVLSTVSLINLPSIHKCPLLQVPESLLRRPFGTLLETLSRTQLVPAEGP